MDKKKILIISNSDAGLYEFRKEVVSALISENMEVHISAPDTGHASELERLGALMHITGLDRRGMNPATDYKLYRGYKALIKEVRPDAILSYTIKPNVYGGVAARQAHVPFLANVTGLGSTLQGDGILKKFIVMLYKMGLKSSACVFFQNEYNLNFMKEVGCIKKDAHTHLLSGSGVNLEEHKAQEYPIGCEDGKIHLLSIGRIMNDKGSEELLKVAEKVHAEHPEVIFDLLGTYEEETREKYEPWVDRLMQNGTVQFHGFRTDVDTFYGICHAVVHPSYHEGMSNVVQEAAAAARPVLTSDIPGCNEIYENGIGGIAFEPKSEDALKCAIDDFLALSMDEKKEMGKNARKYVEEHFDRKLVVDAYLEELRNIFS